MTAIENEAAAALRVALKQPTMPVETAAQLLGISRGVAYAAARSGNLPVRKFGRRYVVITASLRRMLDMEPAHQVDREAA